MKSRTVVVDTSVLVNFLLSDRVDLIGEHPDSFVTTEQVAEEITVPEQKRRDETALAAGCLVAEQIGSPPEVATFLRLRQNRRLGAGESSAIAVGRHRGYRLASDDKRAVNRAIREIGVSRGTLSAIRTQDIVVELVVVGALSVPSAEEMLRQWSQRHSFSVDISSFRRLLGQGRAAQAACERCWRSPWSIPCADCTCERVPVA